MFYEIILISFFIHFSTSQDCTVEICVLNDDGLRFFVLGDFGGLPIVPYFTMTEDRTAKYVNKYGRALHTHFNMELGDNFYFNGVTNSDDSRFISTFEQVFVNDGRPWYMLAGNHDHYGNVTGQIEYSKKSERWKFPSLFYTIKYAVGNITIDIVMIDTVTLCGNTPADVLADEVTNNNTSFDTQPEGPADVLLAATKWGWVEEQLNSSTADYLLVMGHFPVYSVAEHGPTSCLVTHLLPLLNKYKVTAYMSGHDHSLQHIAPSSAYTQFIVSGAASRAELSTTHAKKIPKNSLKFMYPNRGGIPLREDIAQESWLHGGFAYVNITQDALKFSFIRANGKLIYKNSMKKREM